MTKEMRVTYLADSRCGSINDNGVELSCCAIGGSKIGVLVSDVC